MARSGVLGAALGAIRNLPVIEVEGVATNFGKSLSRSNRPAYNKGPALAIDVPQEESAPYEFGIATPGERVNRIMELIDSPAQGASKPYRPVPAASSGGVPTYALIAIAAAGAFVMFKGMK